MINNNAIRFTVTLIGCLLSAITMAAEEGRPGISLTTFYGDRVIDQSADDPLLLTVLVENATANAIKRQNRRNQKIIGQYAATDEYKNLSDEELAALREEYPLREIPMLVLGSAAGSLESLIEFHVRNSQGQTVELAVRPLASNDKSNTSTELGLDQQAYYQFVVESGMLKQLPPGAYHIVAALDTSTQSGMWQGAAYSKSVVFTVYDPHPDPEWPQSDVQALLQSTYLIEDRQFTAAEKHATGWTQRDPRSVDAWAQLGEAQYGQGKTAEALTSFNTALLNFRAKYGVRPVERPLAIIDRINEIEDLAVTTP